MSKYRVLLLLVTLAAGSSVSAQTSASLENVSWLSGCWEGRQGTAVIEEMWSKPAGTSMLGLGRTVKDNRTVSFEFMQFREENGSLFFLPQPQGGAQVRFPLKEMTRAKLIFENPTHDFPQRVSYERKSNCCSRVSKARRKESFRARSFK
jgi:hypothetical protein